MTKKRKTFYEDLGIFVLDWMTKRNKEKEKPKMSEIIGGLEMVKTDFYWTQNWFIDKTINKQLKKKITQIIAKLGGKEIQIHPDGSLIIMETKK